MTKGRILEQHRDIIETARIINSGKVSQISKKEFLEKCETLSDSCRLRVVIFSHCQGYFIWVRVLKLRGPIDDGGTHFRRKIILGTVLVRFLVFSVKFLGCSGTVPDCTRTYEFKMNLSNFYRAPRIRLSALLNS